MSFTTCKNPVLVSFLLCLLLLGGSVTYAQKQNPKVEPQPETKELEQLIKNLEDPKKRDALIKELKLLLEAQRKLVKKEEQKPQPFFERLSHSILNLVKETKDLPSNLFRERDRLLVFLEKDKRISILINLAVLLISALSAYFIKARQKVPLEIHPAPNKKALFMIGLKAYKDEVLPYFVMYVSYKLLCSLLAHYTTRFYILDISIEIAFWYYIISATISPNLSSVLDAALSRSKAQFLLPHLPKLKNLVILLFIFLFIHRVAQLVSIAKDQIQLIANIILLSFMIKLTSYILLFVKDITAQLGHDKISQNKILNYTLVFAKYFVILYTWFYFANFLFRDVKNLSILLNIAERCFIVWGIVFVLGYTVSKLTKKLTLSAIYKAWAEDIGDEAALKIIREAKIFILVTLFVIGGVITVDIIMGILSTELRQYARPELIKKIVSIIVLAGFTVGAYILSGLLNHVILHSKLAKKSEARFIKIKTLGPVIESALKVGIIFVGGVSILNTIGINVAPILAGAGIIGLAVGFGAQTLVKDLINGLFILFEESIRVGDVVNIAGKAGIVEKLTIKSITLRDLDGNVHVIPTSEINIITNMTKEFSMALIDVGISYREDVDEVIKVLKDLGEEMMADPEWSENILAPLEVLGLDRFEDSQVVIRARFKTKPLKQWAVRREFNRRVKARFDELGIEIPFPHLTLYMGTPKRGDAPALNVNITNRVKSEQ